MMNGAGGEEVFSINLLVLFLTTTTHLLKSLSTDAPC